MPRKKKDASGVDPALDRAITTLLKEVTLEKKGEDGKRIYSLTDVCKVIDRKLKLEAIKAKMDDPGYGSAFDDDTGDDA